ncbi:hypothetical protein AB0O58_25855 [Rhodococcus sp. NPDC080181]|uniref:hypothetical protein n=1 Tax=Rhodococcus sp. NPDC080181 TaxID=3155292 RepID=UPI00344D1508
MDKPIKLAGFSAATPLARQLVAANPAGMISLEQIPMLAVFTLQSTTFDYVGHQHVPQLRLIGRLDRLIPENPQEMPYNIGEIGLNEEESIRIVGDYPFNAEQLATLLDKGMYMDGFGPPEKLAGLPFEVDTRIDLRILPPNQEGAPPLAIADLAPMRFFDMRFETSGYELAEQFPDHRGPLIEAGKITGHEVLGVDQELTSEQADLADFSFGRAGEAGDPRMTAGSASKNLVERLTALLDVDLDAPRALRGLREDMRAVRSRSDRVRANLLSPGLADDSIESIPLATDRSTTNDDELGRAAAQLENIDLDDLDLSGFSLDDDSQDDDTSLPTLTLSTQDPIVASLIAEHEDNGFSFGEAAEDDSAIKARKARQAREASARRARQNQQTEATHHLSEGNAPRTTDHDGPQLGG